MHTTMPSHASERIYKYGTMCSVQVPTTNGHGALIKRGHPCNYVIYAVLGTHTAHRENTRQCSTGQADHHYKIPYDEEHPYINPKGSENGNTPKACQAKRTTPRGTSAKLPPSLTPRGST